MDHVVNETIRRIQDLYKTPVPEKKPDEGAVRFDLKQVSTHAGLRKFANALNKNFHNKNTKIIMRNLKWNRRYLRPDKNLADYRGALRDSAAIIVAMGPGYDQNLDRLKELSKLYPVFCIDRAYPALEEAGIKPVLVMVVDRIARPVKNKVEIPLAASGITNKAFLRHWKGKKFMFGTITGEEIDQEFAKIFRAPVYLGHSGNVSGALFTFVAGIMDARIIIFHGHTFGTFDDPKNKDWISLGDKFWTRMDYYYYCRWLEAQIHELYGERAFINLQPDGLFDVARNLRNVVHGSLTYDILYEAMLEQRWTDIFDVIEELQSA